MKNPDPAQLYSDERIYAYAREHGVDYGAALKRLLAAGIYPERLKRNSGLVSIEAQIRLLDLPIFIAGCGGLGGEMAANLVQLGAGCLYLCDFDEFEESNLNRQRFAGIKALGGSKAEITAKALKDKAPWGSFTPIVRKITPDNAPAELLKSAILIDCLDSVEGKIMLENLAQRYGLPWLYGAVLEHEGFACLQAHPNGLLKKLYGERCEQKGAGSVLSHVVSGTASLMCALFVKWLANPDFTSSLAHADFSIPALEPLELE